MSEKYNAALGAFNKIKDISGTLNIGIGTGSTTDIFTEHFLPKLREKIKYIYSSSIRTTELLNKLNFNINAGKPEKILDIYIDGADEVDKGLNLIKGGGGAHTNEKIIAASADYFICIIDPSKLVENLGQFPLPVEVSLKYKDEIIHQLHKYTSQITTRDELSDNGNVLLDLHGMQIFKPLEMENELNSIKGIIEVGIFAKNKPQLVVVGNNDNYRLIES